MITTSQLAVIFDKPEASFEKWIAPLEAVFLKYDITTPLRQAAFLAQVGHESAGLSVVKENLNYSAAGLMGTFGKYFKSTEIAKKYERKPEMIANRVYANRFGNGDEASGDGWKHRGRGLIQVTFHDNYRDCGKALGIDLLGNPDLLLEPLYAALSAGWYWDSRKLNGLADAGPGCFSKITLAINGGHHGEEDRNRLYKIALQVLS